MARTTQHNVTVGAILGIPIELWVVFVIAIVAVVFIINRAMVRDIPVGVNWMFDNHTGRRLVGGLDLNGVFVRIKSARGKMLETVKKAAIPFDITHIEGYKAYVADDDAKRLKEWQQKKRAYDAKEEGATDPGMSPKLTGYLMHQGGLRHTTEIFIHEGDGVSFDPLVGAGLDDEDKGPDAGHTSILHEMKAAAKEFLKLWAESTRGTFQALILPMMTGIGIGAMIMVILGLVTGHPL